MENIPTEVLFNLIMVEDNVRPAMLLQPAEFGEKTGQDIYTNSILQEIKNFFPTLIQSENYSKYQGIIISKTSYDNQLISLEKMGEILGYPCYQDYETLNINDSSKMIEIIIEYKRIDLQLEDNFKAYVFSNKCSTFDKLSTFKEYVAKIVTTFAKPKYVEMLKSQGIAFVSSYVKTTTNYSTDELINMVVEQKERTEDVNEQLSIILYNLMLHNHITIDRFEPNNPIHNGILISLLLNYKCDLLEPFIPLQQFPGADDKITNISNQWSENLLQILEKTKNKTQTTGGNKNKTKRKKGAYNKSVKVQRYKKYERKRK